MSASGGDVTASLEERARALVRVYDGFPRPRVRFRDVSGILEREPALFRELVAAIADPYRDAPPDLVLGVESWGFVFGACVAYELGRGVALARRPGKLPMETLSRAYDMSYDAGRKLEIHVDAIAPGQRVLVVDDVLASGGTVLAAIHLIEAAHGRAVGVSVAFELTKLNGRGWIESRDVPVLAVVRL